MHMVWFLDRSTHIFLLLVGHQLDPVNWQKKNHAFEMQFVYFGEVNPLLQMLEKDEKQRVLTENRKMFVGHMWLKYYPLTR